MSDEIEIPAGVQPVEFEESEFKYVPDDGQEDTKGPDLAALQKELAEKTAQLESLQPQANMSQALDRLAQLQEASAKVKPQPEYSRVQPIAQVPIDPASEDAKFNEQIWARPRETVYSAARQVVEPLAQIFLKQMEDISKEMVLMKDSDRKLYEKYGDEIDAEVKRMPIADRMSDSRVYQRAIKTVSARHVDELVKDSVESQVAKRVEEELAKRGISGEPAVKKPAQYSETGSPYAAVGGPKEVKIPRARYEQIEREAMQKGMETQDYIETLKRKGYL